MLNVAALSAAIPVGMRQLWDNGARSSEALLPVFVSVMLIALLTRASPQIACCRPQPSIPRAQADVRRCALERPSRRLRTAHRTLLTLALLLNGTTSAPPSIGCALPHRSRQHRLSVHNLKPQSTAFAVAADLLETAGCLALSRGRFWSALWAVSKAAVFWALPLGHLLLPGPLGARGLGTYRADANLLDTLRTTEMPQSASTCCVQATLTSACKVERCPNPTPAQPPTAHVLPAGTTAARGTSVDLRTAAHPRVLLFTRAARHSNRHARGLSKQERHIGFVVDSGCTYHMHPNVRDLVNVRSCNDTVSGVDGKPHPCVAEGDIPLTARNAQSRQLHTHQSALRALHAGLTSVC
eukprot:5083419-Pleurochrysis_carterae.AAC.7